MITVSNVSLRFADRKLFESSLKPI
ncbi:Protein of unknown function [Bacillus thuringiensis]|uniref:Uncharacterized protein n=1 Tax=Bacillus thuringiensis TaxID=1428 RepID=A0A1C4EN77_BACTU|nr:Protein of unknown function [Bacillus thuringiensis]